MSREEPDDTEIETQSIDALQWLLMHDDTLAAAAANYGIEADLSNEELEGMAYMVERAAYDEGFSIDEESLLSAFKLVRQAAGGSSTLSPGAITPASPDTD